MSSRGCPHTIRAFGLAPGWLTIEELLDRYSLQCTPIRNLIIDCLRERQPSLDFASLDAASRTLAELWSQLETIILASTRCGCRRRPRGPGRNGSASNGARSPTPPATGRGMQPAPERQRGTAAGAGLPPRHPAMATEDPARWAPGRRRSTAVPDQRRTRPITFSSVTRSSGTYRQAGQPTRHGSNSEHH